MTNNKQQKHRRPKLGLELLLLTALKKEWIAPRVEAFSESYTERLHRKEQCKNKEVLELAELCQEDVFSTGSPRLPFVLCPLEGHKYELFIAASEHFEIILSCLKASVDILIVYCTF